YRIVEAGGRKIGITAVLGDKLHSEVNNDQLTLTSAETALETVVPKLKAEGCDLLVLLSYGSPEESSALARRFPEFNVVVTSSPAEEPPHDLRTIEGQKTVLVAVGHKGKYALALGLYDDPREPWRYQRVPLDGRFPDAPDMQKLMVAYQGQLEELGLEGLGLRPKIHPRAIKPGDVTGQFVGSAKCGECHK